MTSQVPIARKKFGAHYVLEQLAAGLWDKEESSKRHYPGEVQGSYLTEHFNSASHSRAKQNSLSESVYILQEIAVEMKRRSVPKNLGRLRERIRFAEEYLVDEALSGLRKHFKNRWALGIHKDGLIVKPTTLEARAAMAALWLAENGRIDRVRQCLHCRAWFFARFKHQVFCRDRKKMCQWNHYHTPEWRRQHREQNKKHQRAYRQRTFGGPRRA